MAVRVEILGMDRVTKSVKPQELKAWLSDSREIALFDVREAGPYSEGHPFFAVPLHYSRLELDIDQPKYAFMHQGTVFVGNDVTIGDNVTIGVKLIAPIAMDEGLRFAIREGGRTVGSGVVSKITK